MKRKKLMYKKKRRKILKKLDLKLMRKTTALEAVEVVEGSTVVILGDEQHIKCGLSLGNEKWDRGNLPDRLDTFGCGKLNGKKNTLYSQ